MPEDASLWDSIVAIGKHILNDILPSSDVREAAYDNTREAFDLIQRNSSDAPSASNLGTMTDNSGNGPYTGSQASERPPK